MGLEAHDIGFLTSFILHLLLVLFSTNSKTLTFSCAVSTAQEMCIAHRKHMLYVICNGLEAHYNSHDAYVFLCENRF